MLSIFVWLEANILKSQATKTFTICPPRESNQTEESGKRRAQEMSITVVCAVQFAGIAKLFGCSRTIRGFLGKFGGIFAEDIRIFMDI